MGKIRLACMFCDREDFDGVDAVPADWFSVDEAQTYEASVRTIDMNHSDNRESVLDWFTHLGVCPECYEAEIRPPIEVS